MSKIKDMMKALGLSREFKGEVSLTGTAARNLEALAALRGESREKTVEFLLNAALRHARARFQRGRSADDFESIDEATLCLLWNLSERDFDKIREYARMRGESIPETFNFFARDAALFNLPARPHWSHYLKDLDFTRVQTIDGRLAQIQLRNGRVFTDYYSSARHQKLFYAFRDQMPQSLTPETYQVALNAMSRYQRGAVPRHLMPPAGSGGTMMECGAYVGFKAIAYADVVGPTGRVIAIEIDEDNCRLMARNIADNKLQHVIAPVCCAVWNQRGTMVDRFEEKTRHTIAQTDQHHYAATKVVQTDTLDNIMDEHKVGIVDFMNLQLNGAEPEALEGLVRHFDSVKVLHMAAMFSHKGVDKRSMLRETLLKRGCTILHEGRNGRGAITAATPRFAHEFDSLKSNAAS